jgi:hypothetical protein
MLLMGNLLMAQDSRHTVTLQLNPSIHNQKLSLNKEFELNGEKMKIETFRFYISNISLLKDEKTVWREEYSYHLVDASVERSMKINLQLSGKTEFDKIQFDLGIDSLTNVSGVMGGDLDPTKGMYWAWQSGYINFKLEGTNPGCQTRNNSFQYHLGGYLPPYASVQTVQLNVAESDILNIRVDIASFLEKIDCSNIHSVMSPGEKAVELSQLASAIFNYDEE